jgi:hypothetical protein
MISVGERLGVGRRCVWMDFMFLRWSTRSYYDVGCCIRCAG